MDNSNKDSKDQEKMSSEEEVKELLKSIAVHEAKSAIAKIKLAKFAAVKGAQTISKGAKKFGSYVEQRINNSKKK